MNACEDSLAQSEAHRALFYRDSDEYVGGILDFIGPGLERDEPVAIAVPAPKLTLLRAELGPRADAIELLDMFELGRNPGRIIPAVLGMIGRHAGKPLRYVGEPIWPGRSLEEIREATRHEALINLAWPDADISVLCPYDAEGLDDRCSPTPSTRTPASSATGASNRARRMTTARCRTAASSRWPIRRRAHSNAPFEIGDLGQLRAWVAGLAAASGLDADRAGELVIAINELTTNTVKHADTHGVLRFWQARRTADLPDRGRGSHRGSAGGPPAPDHRHRWTRPVDGQPAVRSRRAPHERGGNHHPRARRAAGTQPATSAWRHNRRGRRAWPRRRIRPL